MLRISKKADYAVFLLGYLARRGAYPTGPAEDSVVSAQEISRQAGLNKSVVANLLKEFTKDGVLDSVRGLKGGYRLVISPHELTLARILEVVDGPFTLVDCIRQPHPDDSDTGVDSALEDEHQCTLIEFCPTRNPMQLVHARISELFQHIKLAELCGLAAPAHSDTAPLTPDSTGVLRR